MELAAHSMFKYFRWLLLLPVAFASCQQAVPTAQPRVNPIANVSKIRFSNNIYDNLRYTSVEHGSVPDSALGKITIDKALPKEWMAHRVSTSAIEKELLLKITLFNPSDSVQRIYFYPGAYFTSIQMFRIIPYGSGVLKIDEKETPEEYRKGFRYLEIQPGDSSAYVARLKFVRTTATMFYPAVLHKDYIDAFISNKMQARAKTSMFTYVASGIMLMMIFYSIAVYRRNGSNEFIYYCGYAACLAILLFLKSYLLYDFTTFNYFFESYWDFLVQCLGVGFYFLFIRKFLDTKKNHPFLEKTFQIGQIIIVALLSVYTVLFFFSSNFIWLNLFENVTKQILLVIGLMFIVYGIKRRKDKLLRFLVLGNIYLLVFSLLSLLLIVTPIQFVKDIRSPWAFLNSALLYYEIGLVAELMLFLSGLAYKNRKDIIERTKEKERFRIDSERKEMEKQMAILEAQQEERNRISADMHDELGSGVTAIRLMSEIVRSKMKDSTLPEIDKISNSANDLITKMNTIIWTMTSANDTVENLITYIRTYAIEFFENTNIECEFKLPSPIPNVQLSGEKRRNMFLAVKESLTNILKHSKASKVIIDVSVSDKLYINIQDDGVGVNFETIRRFGNGLKNIKTRLERIDGKFTILNNEGARTEFEMRL